MNTFQRTNGFSFSWHKQQHDMNEQIKKLKGFFLEPLKCPRRHRVYKYAPPWNRVSALTFLSRVFVLFHLFVHPFCQSIFITSTIPLLSFCRFPCYRHLLLLHLRVLVSFECYHYHTSSDNTLCMNIWLSVKQSENFLLLSFAYRTFCLHRINLVSTGKLFFN